MTTNNYQKQGAEFMKTTVTKMIVKFSGHKRYFDDDKQSRDVFRITLKNNAHKYDFNFGQSINDSTGNGDNKPTYYDILVCLTKYPVYDFEDFCSEYGYDTDSRKAYKTYKAVKREWENVNKLFTEEQLELLREIN